MKNPLAGLKVRPKRRANGSPRTGETSADLLRSVPTSFPTAAPAEQPSWRDIEAYDPQVLSVAAGRGVTNALEGTKQLLGGARDYLGGFMQSVREKSPVELQGIAPARSKETYASVNRAVSEAAQDPLTTAKNLASAFVDVGIQAAKSPASMTEFIAGNITPGGRSKPAVAQVVKPKGGDFPKKLLGVEVMKTWEPDIGTETSKEQVINNWLDTKLAKYIRNEMATPEDPIRKLAEEGILHVDPEQLNFDLNMYGRPIMDGDGNVIGTYGKQSFPRLLAKSETAKAWEGASDNSLWSSKAKELIAKESAGANWAEDFRNENPWITQVAQVDPERKIYFPSEDIGSDLGFEHLRDELLNSIDPASGLPRQLQLTNEQLGRMSVPDAVRHVSKINTWREKQKAEANFALANNAATVPFKDYPEQRYGWFQLKADTPEGKKALEDALRYEGDTMGHCVGGYCEDVLTGRSQIYSLRDKKTGAPHVTIEVEPGSYPVSGESFARLDPQTRAQYREYVRQWRIRNPRIEELTDSDTAQALKEAGVPLPPGRILQIKGKGNLKPKGEYIPFVQDFVRSQEWAGIRDFGNTDLIDLTSASEFPNRWVQGKMADHVARQVIQDMQNEGVRFATIEELNARHSAMVKERVSARKAAEPPEQKAARQQLRELRRAERRRERGE